jgi:hypothetical protein
MAGTAPQCAAPQNREAARNDLKRQFPHESKLGSANRAAVSWGQSSAHKDRLSAKPTSQEPPKGLPRANQKHVAVLKLEKSTTDGHRVPQSAVMSKNEVAL